MKKIIIPAFIILIVMNPALSQTNTEKYFLLDSVSFATPHCSKEIVKKKEKISCYTENGIVRIKGKTIIEAKFWSNDPEGAITTTGDLMEVDFIMSKITPKKYNGKDALPVEAYSLVLEAKYDKYPFMPSSKFDKYLKPRATDKLYLPFATYQDAAAAKKYLESLVGIDWEKVK